MLQQYFETNFKKKVSTLEMCGSKNNIDSCERIGLDFIMQYTWFVVSALALNLKWRSRSRRKLCLDRLIQEPRSGTTHDVLLLVSVIAPIAFFETNQKEIMDHNLTLDQIFERFSGGDLHLEIHKLLEDEEINYNGVTRIWTRLELF